VERTGWAKSWAIKPTTRSTPPSLWAGRSERKKKEIAVSPGIKQGERTESATPKEGTLKKERCRCQTFDAYYRHGQKKKHLEKASRGGTDPLMEREEEVAKENLIYSSYFSEGKKD